MLQLELTEAGKKYLHWPGIYFFTVNSHSLLQLADE